ncbi:MAG: GntR family transcriptional regulator [Candidatus Caldatribacteriaceae bacterium]
MRIDRNSVIPLYYQVEESLKGMIEGGQWKTGEALPSEKELQAAYQVSRTTVRQALDLLVRKGMLIRIPGKGTFVVKSKIIHYVGTITSFSEEMLSRGIKPSTKVLDFRRVVPPPSIAGDLGIRAGSSVVLLKRLRFADDEPVAISEVYLPEDLLPGFFEEGLKEESLYNFLEKRYGIVFKETLETVEATAIVGREAKLLKVVEGTPGLVVGRISYIDTGRAIERAYTLYRGDKFIYQNRLVGRV